MDNYTNKLTEEELKSLLKEPSKKQDKVSLTDIPDFLLYYGLEAGSHLITFKLVYTLYKRWSKSALISSKFRAEVGLYLASIQDGLYYLVNQNALNINKHLFNILNKPKVPKSINHKPHFINFIKFYNLVPGTFWLEAEVFYYLYDLWTFNKKKILTNKQVNHLCTLYFTKKQTKSQTYFGVSKMILNQISEQQIQEIKEGVLFKNDKRKKRKEKANKT